MMYSATPVSAGLPEHPRVLLVDDDDVNLMLVSAALGQHGFEVTCCAAGCPT